MNQLETVPLIYNIKRDLTNITNILLIDQSVASYDTFVKSSNATTFPIVYNRQSTREELRILLKSKFTLINRIAIVSHYSPNPYFLENEPLFTTLDTGLASLSSNSLLIVDLIKTLNVVHVDFLACDTLKYENWKSFYGQLKTNCPQVTIGASNNKTGNLLIGGDWILENTKENIQLIYFGEMIVEYNQLLTINSTFPSGMVLWFDAKDPNNNGTTAANGSLITTWFDKSGGNRNATANSTGITYNTSGLSPGYPALTFDSSIASNRRWLTGNVPITGNQATVLVVMSFSTNTGYYMRSISFSRGAGVNDYDDSRYFGF